MKITIAAVVPRKSRTKADAFEQLAADYIARTARYVPVDSLLVETEAAFLASLQSHAGRVKPFAVLLDSRGRQLSSKELAAAIGAHRDQGTQRLVFAIGPADGWAEQVRNRADLLLSFGPITLPHQLARVVLTEQVYRALTILAGHPYHFEH